MIKIGDTELPYPSVYNPQLSANRPMHLMLDGTWKRHGSSAGYDAYLKWDFLTEAERDVILGLIDTQTTTFNATSFLFEDAMMGADMELDSIFLELGEMSLNEDGTWSLELNLIEL